MPQAVNLVVKNAAAVDKTFTLMTPAAGDGGIAEWALKEGAISSAFPRITAQATRTPNKARNVKVKIGTPSSYVDATNGLTMVGSRAEANLSVTVPDDYPEAMRDDFVAYVANAISTALVKSMLRDGVPAT